MRSPVEKAVRAPFAHSEPTGRLQQNPSGAAPGFPIRLSPLPPPTAPAQAAPAASPAQLYELGLTTAAMSYHTAAIEALRECVAHAPDHAPAWRKLAEMLRLAREDAEADAAERAAQASTRSKWKKASGERIVARLQKAERKLLEPLKSRTEEEAAGALRDHLIENPLDSVAMRWLARLELRSGDTVTARNLFERALELSPAYSGAREDYAEFLLDERESAALAETEYLLSHEPRNVRYRNLHVHALIDNGKVSDALELLVGLLREDPNNARYWLTYGMALRAMGRTEESVQAYRKCLQLQPEMGEAWWGLAELKDKVLTQDDIAAMRMHLESETLSGESRMHMLYALGQTLERAGEFAASFAAYEDAARVFCTIEEKKPDAREQPAGSASRVQRIKTVFGRENLASKLAQAPAATAGDTPIFVVGMPRAGSTLVEQILSSHSLVEGIGERALVSEITRELALSRMLVEQNAYPECLLEYTPERLAALGARLISNSRNYRRSDRPYFVDKRPWNWLEVGLIHLILPRAKIIDIRREPMAACFAMYKQLLPRSCNFSYDMKELGRYYNTYVSMMDHWQTVLPGRVHFVRYEQLIENTEFEIRRLLNYCGLPFEEDCLHFWETERAIVTPSAEQVRRPIFRHALQQWRNFEPWLGPLKEALDQPAEA